MISHHPALSRCLLTYLGNKRSLLGLISEGLDHCAGRLGYPSTPESPSRPLRFADPFTGSGVVARLARLRGYRVHANDLEIYTRPFGTAFLQTSPDELDALFSPVARTLSIENSDSPYKDVLAFLNELHIPTTDDALYFSRHYAPAETTAPDLNNERIFYTQENARRIDAILAAVHDPTIFSPKTRDILLASLLVEMSIHINTSGVMKGFHRGWGGRGGDALSRIMAPIELEPLPLMAGPIGTVTIGDAVEVFDSDATEGFDITYVDPPYNIHQYGANYHLLTSATLNDRYDPGPVVRGSRAGIRKDHNRSEYCYRSRPPAAPVLPDAVNTTKAAVAFNEFLRSIQTKFLVVSYNNDGIIPAEELPAILSDGRRHSISYLSRRHSKFKGGKNTQSSLHTSEHLFIVERDRHQSHQEFAEIERALETEGLERKLKDRYVSPVHWTSRSNHSTVREKGRTTQLLYLDRVVATLDRRLRVQDLSLWDRWDSDALIAASVSKRELFSTYVETAKYEEALDLLKSFKIRKHHSFFSEAAIRLAPHLDGNRLKKLEELHERVLGYPLNRSVDKL